ncbi:MAG TPA: hypothetical protein VGQ71_13035 [Terriglobales bacterium]|nr:hypothetical protein [Terriglobales bacterium]
MLSFSPVTLAALVVFMLAVVSVAVSYFRGAITFKRYSEIELDVRRIAGAVDGELFRDGDDLVVSGNYNKLPVVVRFSHGEHTPGLNIRMGAPASFSMSAAPRGAAPPEGRKLVRTGNGDFDKRFVIRSDHAHEAAMFLGEKPVMKGLEQLCCSNKTFFGVSKGVMELSELLIPSPYTARHIAGHLESMSGLAKSLEAMPGSHEVKIEEMKRERSSPALRLAVVVGIVAAGVAVVSEVRHSAARSVVELPAQPAALAGVFAADAPLIPGVEQWRLARLEDFDPSAVSWLRASGLEASGRLVVDISGDGLERDVVYLLVRPDGTRRLVLLIDGQNRYDAFYPFVGLIARVPRHSLERIKWVGNVPDRIDGDGVLITRKADDMASGLVLFSSEKHISSGVPANYQNISLD